MVSLEQRGLKVLETDKTFFTKITSTISKLLIPTRVGINGLLINMKRNNVLKAFEAYIQSRNAEDISKKEQEMQKYEETYSLYLEAIDRYIMDSVYKKVKAGTASSFEADALSKYYKIVHLKETEYIEYKHRKQKYLLELDYETVLSLSKEKLTERYKRFYLSKTEALYKGILKNYSIQLADVNSAKFRSNDEIYNKIFATLEEYITSVLPLKIESKEDEVYFYHCPKLNDCNRCKDYEKRPQICRDFPDNPLALLPKSCGYNAWKHEVEPVALMLHSMLEIVEYYKAHLPLRD